jgi:hypothetical protein
MQQIHALLGIERRKDFQIRLPGLSSIISRHSAGRDRI